MKTLILSDIHTYIGKVDHILKNEEWDHCIMVGDYFDQFYDTPEVNRATAEWLKPKLYDDKYTILLGNHEFNNYSKWATEYTWCSGYHCFKDIEINKVLDNKDWGRFKWYHILDNKFLITHGGLHRYHYPDNQPVDFNTLSLWLDKEIYHALKTIEYRDYHWIYGIGQSRGGPLQEGGIFWCDFTREFIPIHGLNQICGHTPQMQCAKWCILNNTTKEKNAQFLFSDKYSPKIEDYKNNNISINLCIDTKLEQYIIWDGNEIKIRSTNHLR